MHNSDQRSSEHFQRLVNLAKNYNSENPHLSLDLDLHDTIDKLIFGLWGRDVYFTDGFGTYYDHILNGCETNKNQKDQIITDLDKNRVYLTYLHSDKISKFLGYSLVLPKSSYYDFVRSKAWDETAEQNLITFNKMLSYMEKRDITGLSDLRLMLKNGEFNKIELCCLLWECENLCLFNIGTCVQDFLEIECGLIEEDWWTKIPRK